MADVASIPDPELTEQIEAFQRLPPAEAAQEAARLVLSLKSRFNNLNSRLNDMNSRINDLGSLKSRFYDQIDRAKKLVEELEQDNERIARLMAVSDYAARLAEEARESEDDALMKALALYETALEAKARDQRIVIVTKDYKFVREITGIGRPATEPRAEVAAS